MKELRIEAVTKAVLTNPSHIQGGSVSVKKTNSWSCTRKYFSRKKCDLIRRKLEKEGNVGGK